MPSCVHSSLMIKPFLSWLEKQNTKTRKKKPSRLDLMTQRQRKWRAEEIVCGADSLWPRGWKEMKNYWAMFFFCLWLRVELLLYMLDWLRTVCTGTVSSWVICTTDQECLSLLTFKVCKQKIRKRNCWDQDGTLWQLMETRAKEKKKRDISLDQGPFLLTQIK